MTYRFSWKLLLSRLGLVTQSEFNLIRDLCDDLIEENKMLKREEALDGRAENVRQNNYSE